MILHFSCYSYQAFQYFHHLLVFIGHFTSYIQTFYFQDDLEVFRPFNNIVKLKFDSSTSLNDSQTGYVIQSAKAIAERLSTYGTVTGQLICDRGKTGYFNFANREGKEDALKAYLHETISSFKMEDYTTGQSRDKHELRPFRNVLCAAYRPSIHSTSRIIRYLDKFGTNAGRELVYCPYDPDRLFMYFAYNDGRTLSDPAISGRDYSFIEGCDVSRDYQVLDSKTSNNVFLFPFMGHDVRKYRANVDVCTRGVSASQLREFMSHKYGDVSRVNKGRESEEGLYYDVLFKDKYSGYRILYQKTHHGRVIETIPETSDQIFISQPNAHKMIWMHHSLRLYRVPELPDGDVLGYFDGFLNWIGCNPGIVAVSRKQGVKATFYELYFANPWHTFDVHNRIIQSKTKGLNHELYCSVNKERNDGMNFYGAVKEFLI